LEFKKLDSGYFIRLERGESVMESLSQFLDEKQIQGGVLNGIGALENVKIGYFDINKKEYLQKEFSDIYEVVSFLGNISLIENKAFVHAHIILGDRNYNTHAGHFFDGKVAVTMELFIRVFEKVLQRETDKFTNLNFLKLD
jgi:predicted DNA-binding protein with PD1-like motif